MDAQVANKTPAAAARLPAPWSGWPAPWRHAGLALLCAGAVSCLTALPAFDRLRGLDIDLLHGLAAVLPGQPDAAGSPVVVIALDERTYVSPPFAGLPKVMWTPLIASVQDAVLDAGARVIGWDFILPTSASAYVADRGFDASLMRSLARARQDGRVVLGTVQLSGETIAPHRAFAWAVGGPANLRTLNLPVDGDGVVRRVPTFVEVEKAGGERSFVPAMALELAARAKGQSAARGPGGGVSLDGAHVPGTANDLLTLNFTGRAADVPTYSLADLYACEEAGRTEFFASHFAGKAVLFGLVLDIEDRKLAANRLVTEGGPPGATPACMEGAQAQAAPARRSTIPGVYVHATAIGNILLGDGLTELGWGARLLLTLPLAMSAALATMFLGPLAAVAALAAACLAWMAVAMVGFSHAVVVPFVSPLAAALSSFALVLALRFAVIDKSRRFLRRAFSSYVAPALVDALVADPNQLRLGGERRDMSYLFTDLAGFTGLVEKLDPSRAVSILNAYLDGMIDIAKQHGGTIDKIIGDAVVVIFSAPIHEPNHAQRAVACALAMHDFAEAFAAEQRAEGLGFGHTRIGVNSGVATVGNFGGGGFFDYTVLGDAMNTAARLEGANKYLGTRVIVSGETVRRCRSFSGRPVGRLVLQGKEEPTEVFEPLPAEALASEAALRYAAAYALLEREDATALAAFEALAQDHPGDGLIRFHLDRLKAGETGATIVMKSK